MGLSEIIEYYKIRKECKKYEHELIFDMQPLDERISKLADKIYSKNKKKFAEQKDFVSEVGFMASKLYDIGGHTPCLLNLAESLYEETKLPLFLSKIQSSYENGSKVMKKLEVCCDIYGENLQSCKFVSSLISLYNKIVTNPPKVIFLYIHPHDILAAAVIHLLKTNTDIKFAFFNHSSHFPNLGMTMADVILECSPTIADITNKRRHLTNCRVVGLQSKKMNEIKYYSDGEISEKKKELGILEDNLLTVSGGSSYKYFEDNKSPHFEMIKRILKNMPNLYHLAITILSEEQQKILDEIFEDSPDEKKRLIFHPFTPNYDILFQCADLFIDSFPISSAMTQIDLMSMKVPSVVKINNENPIWSFHDYMPENYPYMFEKVEDMENGILYLIKNKEERKRIAQSNYDFWLNNYESNTVKKKYQSIIDELIKDNIELVNFLEIPYDVQTDTRNWRNSKEVSDWFKIPYIDEETHKNWLESLKKVKPSNIAFCIKYNDNFIGVTYFHSVDYGKKCADWGIYIKDTQLRGKHIGSSVIKKSLRYAKNILNLEKIYLDVKNTNIAAIKVYEKNGFKILGRESDEPFLRYELIL